MFGCGKEGKGKYLECLSNFRSANSVGVNDGKETGLVDKENKNVQVGRFDC